MMLRKLLVPAIVGLASASMHTNNWPVTRYSNGTVTIAAPENLHMFAGEGADAAIFGNDILTNRGSLNHLFDRVAALETSAADGTQAPVTTTEPERSRGEALQNQTEMCDIVGESEPSRIEVNASTAQWGTYFPDRDPVATVKDGQTFEVEVLTHHSGHDYAKMIKGDSGAEDVYYWPEGDQLFNKSQGLSRANGSGVHIITGPVKVCGVEKDDIVEIRINKLRPRKHPEHGRTFGTNSNKFAGYPFRVGHQPGAEINGSAEFNQTDGGHEQITVYEFITNDDGEFLYGKPVYQFVVPTTEGPDGKNRTADTEPALIMPHTYNYGYNGELMDLPNIEDSSNIMYEEGFSGTKLLDSGLGTGEEIVYNPFGFEGDFKVPLRPHLGIMGVQPGNIAQYNDEDATDGGNSIPPSRFGGNIDDHRIGEGGIMYYRAEVEGGNLFFGDTHAAEGDSELAGTAMETSMTAEVTVYVHKVADGLPTFVRNLTWPLLETAEYWVVHGFAFTNYLDELEDPSEIFSEGDSIDMAFEDAYNKTVNWLRSVKGLSEAEAITMMSLSVDFGVTQVVDGNWGVHALIPKFNFDTSGAAFDYTCSVPAGGRPGVGSDREPLSLQNDTDYELSGTYERMTKRPSGRKHGVQESNVERRLKNKIYTAKSQLHRALAVQKGFEKPSTGTAANRMYHDMAELYTQERAMVNN